jgi:hypothetical protein
MIPWAFRNLRARRALRVIQVGLALACLTGAILGAWVGFSPTLVIPATFVVGCIWAASLLDRKVLGEGGRRRFRWLVAVPLAMLNAALVGGLVFASAQDGIPAIGAFIFGGFFGVVAGLVAWLPALILTFLCLGLPMAAANRRAARGLAGEDEGDMILGVTCALWGLAAFALVAVSPRSLMNETPTDPEHVVRIASVLTLLLGAAFAAVAGAREPRRRKFVQDVERGALGDFRVVAAAEGRVLVRVLGHGVGYRVTEVEEPICEVDEAGRCLASLARSEK